LLPNVSEVWRRNHPWAAVYSFGVDRPRLAQVMGRVAFGTDMGLLYRATETIGELPDGAAVLDIPCGSGVALRGIRPGQRLRYVAGDISEAMLERTGREAKRRGVADVVELRQADVEALPFADGEFDLVVSFTGLHCFPDPHRAVLEIARVVRPGGRITGSAFLTDGRRYEPMRLIGRSSGLMGPSASEEEVRNWLAEGGFEQIELERSGPLGYFGARKAGASASG
jgi:ubiquinone/menaquinone biosynthesis C-methylase UbiE